MDGEAIAAAKNAGIEEIVPVADSYRSLPEALRAADGRAPPGRLPWLSHLKVRWAMI